MSKHNDLNPDLTTVDRATLKLLAELEADGQTTQRGLAQRIGVALGLTNSLLKRAARKGLVKAKQAPAKRFAYYVTPKGFREKSRLVGEYLSTSLSFFRHARDEYSILFQQILKSGHKRVVLYGFGELAEIAVLSARDLDLDICGVVHFGSDQSKFSGLSVFSSFDDPKCANIDAVVITDAAAPQVAYDKLVGIFGAERVFAVPLLHISTNGTRGRR